MQKLTVGIVFDDSLDSTDGVSQQVRILGKWLDSRGHKVSYLVGETKMASWSNGRVYSLARNVGVRFNGNRLSMPLIPSTKAINAVVDKNDFDVLHVQAPFSPLMASKVILRAGRLSAVVASFHILPSGSLASVGSRAVRLLMFRSLHRLDEVSATSQQAAEFAQRAYGLSCRVIPNTIETDIFRSARTNFQSNRIVFLGRLVPRKGCDILIRAFSRVVDDFPDANLVIVGRGAQKKKLESLAQELGVSSKISFAGFVSEEDKPKYLAEAQIACFPSYGGESFGIVLIEAMAAGSGVVLGGDNPGYRSVLGPKPELLFNPRDEQELATKLRTYLSDLKRVSEIRDWQENYVKEFDVQVVGPKIEAMYYRAVAKRSRTQA